MAFLGSLALPVAAQSQSSKDNSPPWLIAAIATGLVTIILTFITSAIAKGISAQLLDKVENQVIKPVQDQLAKVDGELKSVGTTLQAFDKTLVIIQEKQSSDREMFAAQLKNLGDRMDGKINQLLTEMAELKNRVRDLEKKD